MAATNRELGLIESSWGELTRLVDRIGPEGLSLRGGDGWQIKDHLAHVAAWEHSLIALFEGRDRLAAMGLMDLPADTDRINEALWTLHGKESPEQALRYFHDSHARLVSALGTLSDADLQLPYSHYQPGDPDESRPASNWVAGNTYEHYDQHVGWMNQLIKESSAAR